MQDHAADQLHVEMALAERALGRLAHGGEGRHQDVVERLAVGELLPELVGARAQRVVGELLELRLERVDRVDPRLVLGTRRSLDGAEKLAGDGADHCGQILTLGGPRRRPAAREMRHFSGNCNGIASIEQDRAACET